MTTIRRLVAKLMGRDIEFKQKILRTQQGFCIAECKSEGVNVIDATSALISI